MRDELYIGCSPSDEDCASCGTSGYFERAAKELGAFISQLRRVFGVEPAGCRLKVKWERHSFGEIGGVFCVYDTDYPDTVRYAYRVEEECPDYWDDQARNELGLDKGNSKGEH